MAQRGLSELKINKANFSLYLVCPMLREGLSGGRFYAELMEWGEQEILFMITDFQIVR